MTEINQNTLKIIEQTYQKNRYKLNPTCYFYDLDKIEANINSLVNLLPKQIKLYYAMKANNHNLIMESVCSNKNISGIEIASAGELEQALKHIDSQNIIFTGPGKTEYELEIAIKNNIRTLNIESVVEAIRINEIAKKLNVKKVDILIRINLDYAILEGAEKMAGCSTKLGIDQKDYLESFNIINTLEHINIKGIHVFSASGVLDYEQLVKCDKYIFDLVLELEKNTKKIDIIDFGGGLGIDYDKASIEFDIISYTKELNNLIKQYQFENKEFIMELGTYIVGNAGYYTAKIIDIKENKGKKHIIIAGGINHIGLPFEMKRMHPVYILKQNIPKLYEKQPKINNEYCDISGPLCMVSDKLSWNQFIEEANIGDILIYLQSGAYCYKEGMLEFLSHPYPDELIIKKGSVINGKE